MGKPTGFLEYKREAPSKLDPLERVKNWQEFQVMMPEDKLQEQGARCMDCAIPFCQAGTSMVGSDEIGCPVYNLIPEWNDLVYRGKWQEALTRLHKTNNFPEFTGRVCPAPCEGSCTVAINDDPVTIKSIEYHIVEKGFKEAMKNGPLAGFTMDTLKVELKDGSFHPVDSDQLSFELAAKMGYKSAAKSAGAVILEPIMKVEVVTPEENMGDIVGDLNRRRGQVNNMSDRSGAKVIKAEVPLSEMFGYVTTLRTLSSGRATSTMEFSHYAETPSNISEEVIKAAKGAANE